MLAITAFEPALRIRIDLNTDPDPAIRVNMDPDPDSDPNFYDQHFWGNIFRTKHWIF